MSSPAVFIILPLVQKIMYLVFVVFTTILFALNHIASFFSSKFTCAKRVLISGPDLSADVPSANKNVFREVAVCRSFIKIKK
jgi:hypothetical protein